MNITDFCPNCEDYREVKAVEREETYTVKDQKVTILVKTKLCVQCGESIGTDEDDQKILDAINNEYAINNE
jgi:YgiT-type zinc finger domain-containing protein